MKKTVIVGLLLMLLGVICFSVGWGHGGNRTVYWDHGLNVAGVGVNKERTSHYAGIKNIQISTSNPVTIRSGNVSKVVITKPAKTTVTQVGHSLEVRGSNHWRKSFFLGGFHSVRENFGETVITVPKDDQLDALTADLEEYDSDHLNGHVKITGVSVGRLKYSGESNLALKNVHVATGLDIDNMGHIVVNNSRFKNGTISNDFGNIVLKSNTFETLDAETDAGFVSFNTQAVAKRFSADSEAGSINGQIKRDSRTYVSASAELGGQSLFGKSRSTYGNQDATNVVQYRFTTEVGHVKIK